MAPIGVCAECKKAIEGKMLTALGKQYHPEHFVCGGCKQQITSSKFQTQDNLPYCEPCYTKLFAKICKACNEPIKEKIIKALGADWHEEHFVCTACKKPLAGTTFFEEQGNPYCEDDYHETFGSKCKGCGKTIKDKAIIALDAKWHQDCFKCGKCGKPVTESSFQVQNGHPICSQCS